MIKEHWGQAKAKIYNILPHTLDVFGQSVLHLQDKIRISDLCIVFDSELFANVVYRILMNLHHSHTYLPREGDP